MSSFVLRFMVLAFCVLAAQRPAYAGAFLLPEGEGQFIAGVGYVEGSNQFDPSPRAASPAYRKAEASGYLEYGLTSELNIVVAPTLAHQSGVLAANAVTGSDASAIGAHLRLFGGSDWVISLQALIQPPVGLGARDGVATDVRLMFGRSFSVGGLPAFFDLEPGVRLRSDPLPNEARLDVAVGLRPSERLMVLLQDFSSFAPNEGASIETQSYSKLQFSLVYDISRAWSVQVGGFRTIIRRNAASETGPLAAIWYRF